MSTVEAVSDKKFTPIVDDLLPLLKLQPEAGEAPEQFARRVAVKANDEKSLSDDDWQTLDDVTQRWVNQALQNIEKKETISVPEALSVLCTEMEESMKKAKKVAAKAAKVSKPKKIASSGKTVTGQNGKSYVGEKRGPKSQFDLTDKIHVLVDKNPKRNNTAAFKRFELYKNGQTVKQAEEAGLSLRDIRYDVAEKYIEVISQK